jgi:hypothetical protein
MYEILEYFYCLSEVIILFLLLIFKFRRIDPILIQLIDFSIAKNVIWIVGILIVALEFWDFSLNVFIQNIYTILYFIICSRIYKTILLDKKLIQFGNIIFIIVLSSNLIWMDFRFELFNYTISALNLIFIAYGILFLLSRDKDFFSGNYKRYFWLNIALLTYNCCMFPAMIFDRIIIGHSWMVIQKILWTNVLFSSLLLNFFQVIFFYKLSFSLQF